MARRLSLSLKVSLKGIKVDGVHRNDVLELESNVGNADVAVIHAERAALELRHDKQTRRFRQLTARAVLLHELPHGGHEVRKHVHGCANVDNSGVTHTGLLGAPLLSEQH